MNKSMNKNIFHHLVKNKIGIFITVFCIYNDDNNNNIYLHTIYAAEIIL